MAQQKCKIEQLHDQYLQQSLPDCPIYTCKRCQEEVGEEAYFAITDDTFVGCDKCSRYDMEQDGIPLVAVEDGSFIALAKDIKGKGYWDMETRAAEAEEFYQYS